MAESSTYKHGKKIQLFVQLRALKTLGEGLLSEEESRVFLERVKRVPGIKATIKQLTEEISLSNPHEEYDHESLKILEDLCEKIDNLASTVREELGPKSYQPLPRKSKLKHLPHLPLPTFSGEIEDWPVFKKSYDELIHSNRDLSKQDKMKYLMGCIRGGALDLIDGMVPTAENYTALWELFEKKYHNKRLIADSYMEQLFSTQIDEEESVDTLNTFLDTFHGTVKAIDALYIPDVADYFLFYLGYMKLPPETRKAFDESHPHTEFVAYEDLYYFILAQKNKCANRPRQTNKPPSHSNSHNYHSHTQSRDTNSQSPESAESAVLEVALCILCDDMVHPLAMCRQFRQLAPPQRWSIVKQNNRCLNCLKYHGKKECPSSATCLTCGQKHHHMLHQDKPYESTDYDTQSESESDPIMFPETDLILGSETGPLTENQSTSHVPSVSTTSVPKPPTVEVTEPDSAATPSRPPQEESRKYRSPVHAFFENANLTNYTFSPDASNFYFNFENPMADKSKDGAEGDDSKTGSDSCDGYVVRKLSFEVKKL